MLIHLATIFLSLGSLFSASLPNEEKKATDQIWSAMGDYSLETVEHIQPLLAKLTKYPSLAYLKKANNPATVAWILEEYEKIGYGEVNKFKELAQAVIDIMSNFKTAGNTIEPGSNKFKIVQLCLREMTKCSVNVSVITDITPTAISVFPKSIQLDLAEVFPEDWVNLVEVSVKSFCKHVENGYDIKSTALRVEQHFEYDTFTPDHLEMFFEKGLKLDYDWLDGNWMTTALFGNRVDLAYVPYKRGQKVPNRYITPYFSRPVIKEAIINSFADYIAKKHTAITMQAIDEILQDEQASYLKLVPVDVIAKIIGQFLYDLEFSETLTAMVGPFDMRED